MKRIIPLLLIGLVLLFGCDQPSYCGDNVCSASESPYTCSIDCGEPTYKLGDYTFLYSNAYMEDSSFLEEVITYNTEFDRMGTGVGFSTNNTIGDSFSFPVEEGEIIIKSVSADCEADELYAVIMNSNNVSKNYKKGSQLKTDNGIIEITEIYNNLSNGKNCISFLYIDKNQGQTELCVGDVEANVTLTDVRVSQKDCTNVKTLFRLIGNVSTVDFVLTEKTNMYTASMFNDKQTFLQPGDNYSLKEGYFQVNDVIQNSNNEYKVKLIFYSDNGTIIKIAEIREGEEFATKLLIKNIFVGINGTTGIILKKLD